MLQSRFPPLSRRRSRPHSACSCLRYSLRERCLVGRGTTAEEGRWTCTTLDGSRASDRESCTSDLAWHHHPECLTVLDLCLRLQSSDKVAVCPICDEDSGVDAVAFKTKVSFRRRADLLGMNLILPVLFSSAVLGVQLSSPPRSWYLSVDGPTVLASDGVQDGQEEGGQARREEDVSTGKVP